jgi:hypothetical protein
MDWNLVIDIIGWSGAVLVLVAYGLLSARRLEGHSVAFQVMNIQGGACLLVNAAYHRALPSAFVNLVWVFIGCWALIHSLRSKSTVSPVLKDAAHPESEPCETDNL